MVAKYALNPRNWVIAACLVFAALPSGRAMAQTVQAPATAANCLESVAAAAFACGTRRLAVMQWQGASEGYDTGANTGSPSHHSVSHYSFGASSTDRWVAIDTWYAQRFAYALNALKTLGVLDKTIVVWVSEITEGHNQLNMVTPVAGGQALGMKMGKYVKYPFTGNEVEGSGAIAIGQNPANKGLNDLWITVQQALGVQASTFGDPKYCTGPLTDLRG